VPPLPDDPPALKKRTYYMSGDNEPITPHDLGGASRVSELGQLGISSRAYTLGPHSNREDLLYGSDLVLTDRLPVDHSQL
jgi:hypothetical protein